MIPYVVERVEFPPASVFQEISEMCIQVFFNEDNTTNEDETRTKEKKQFFTKEWQLAYLRRLQYSDLRTKTFMRLSPKMAMFAARRVEPESTSDSQKQQREVINDRSKILNPQRLPPSANGSYVAGEIIGFCEIALRRIGLPASEEDRVVLDAGETVVVSTEGGVVPYRPFLTNLAVTKYARKSGVGSALLQTCENTIVSSWNASEILLQVEDDNTKAIEFYLKRGWKEIFADPTTKRYDTNGFFLREIRSTKVCMRKSLIKERAKVGGGSVSNMAKDFVESISNLFFVRNEQ